jgi:hypothetical protein
MLVVGHNVVDVPADRLRRLAHRLQLAVRRPDIPPACSPKWKCF